MIESLIENIQREDLSSIEKAKFIKRIWIQMGKPSYHTLGMKLSVSEHVIQEHLSLIDDKTPIEVKKAVKEGKLAMRSASMISKLPEREQKAIAKEAMKRETGIGRTEVTKLIEEKIPEPIQLERTANNIGDDILTDMSNLDFHINELMEDVNPDDLSKPKMQRLMTTSGLLMRKHLMRLLRFLKEKGVKPDPIIMALIKANGKV